LSWSHWRGLYDSAATSHGDYPDRVHSLIRATPSVNVTWLRFSISVRDVFLKIFQRRKVKKKLKIKLERVIPRRDAHCWRHTHRQAAHRTGHRRRRRLRRLNCCGIIDGRRQRRPPGWVEISEGVQAIWSLVSLQFVIFIAHFDRFRLSALSLKKILNSRFGDCAFPRRFNENRPSPSL